MPVESPTRYYLLVNRKTAAGVTVPTGILIRGRGYRMSWREFIRRPAPTAGLFAVIALTGLLTGPTGASAADALTATDWQYLKTIGYDEHSYALENSDQRAAKAPAQTDQ